MLMSPALFAAMAVFVAGAMILWSNPNRLVNRAVSTCSLHIAMWLACLYFAISAPRGSAEGLFWVRMACGVGGSIAFHFWIVKKAILGELESFSALGGRLIVWGVLSIAMTVVSFTEAFIPSSSTDDRRVYGWGYRAYIGVGLSLYIFLILDVIRAIRRADGSRRAELQVWLLGGCGVAATVLLLMALRSITGDSRYVGASPLLIIVFYIGTALGITTYKIFDARQIVLVGAQKLLLVCAVSLLGWGTYVVASSIVPSAFATIITTALALSGASLMNGYLDRAFNFYPHGAKARHAAFAAAQRENRLEKLESAFKGILEGWGQSNCSLVISAVKGGSSSAGLPLKAGDLAIQALRHIRWATPERLSREREDTDRRALSEFLSEHRLGIAVVAEGPSLIAVFGVGVSASRRPYAFPQVNQLLEIASIMESALERAHFSTKVQHTEQLATVGLLGASLAHEIRNPLVSIKTFAQLLPMHHHDPMFREKFFKLIGEEVGRIDQLTEQLLDLASPRMYVAQLVGLHSLLKSSLDLVSAKAAHKNVRLFTDLRASPDGAYTDGSAAKQVMLNLYFNAIQAAECSTSPERWVKIATRNVTDGVEIAISDSGPGIAPEVRGKLFQPFQTTKSTGFGLGLAICSDILENLNAGITVDPYLSGSGATFRVTFPCPPSLS